MIRYHHLFIEESSGFEDKHIYHSVFEPIYASKNLERLKDNTRVTLYKFVKQPIQLNYLFIPIDEFSVTFGNYIWKI